MKEKHIHQQEKLITMSQMEAKSSRTSSHEHWFVLVFIGLLVISMLTQWLPDRSFSDLENRYLAKIPTLQWRTLWNGQFTSDVEAYIQDQVLGRDQWIVLKTTLEQGLGKKESNGVYFGEDGWYFEAKTEIDMALFHRNIQYASEFAAFLAQKNIPTAFLPIYSSYSFYLNQLPENHENIVEQDLVQQLQNHPWTLVDPYQLLEANKQESIYFKTDHHWTQRGAYEAYLALQSFGDYAPIALGDVSKVISPNPFFGTLYSKAPRWGIRGDEFVVYQNALASEVYIPESNKTGMMINPSYFTTKDQYQAFFGGNQGELVIKTGVKNGKTLLVLKDSYANALVPWLANHYEQIVMIDLRYYPKSVASYVETMNPSQVLLAYNIGWFAADENIKQLAQFPQK